MGIGRTGGSHATPFFCGSGETLVRSVGNFRIVFFAVTRFDRRFGGRPEQSSPIAPYSLNHMLDIGNGLQPD